MTAIVVALVIIVALGIAAAGASVRILREYERAVVFRLGRLVGAKGPGVVLLVPLVDRMVRVDLRTVTFEIPPQDVITRDNVPAKVNAVAYFRVMDPVKSVVEARSRPPQGAVDEDLAERGRRAAHHTDMADEALDAGVDPRAPDHERGACDDRQQCKGGERHEDDDDDDEQRPTARPVDRERRAARERDDAGQAEGAVRGQVGFGDQETCAGAQQQDAQEHHGFRTA